MPQHHVATSSTTPTFRDAAQAFNEAIASGRLSADPASPRYAGLFMYMHTSHGQDAFKNVMTRTYLD